MLFHGKGVEVDKNDPELQSVLEELYSIIVQYDPENVYNMDETGLFFRLLPRYSNAERGHFKHERQKENEGSCFSNSLCQRIWNT